LRFLFRRREGRLRHLRFFGLSLSIHDRVGARFCGIAGDEIRNPIWRCATTPARSVVTNDFVSHRRKEKSKPRPSKSGRVGHPEWQRPGKRQTKCLVDDVQGWYYSAVRSCQSKCIERVAHPRIPLDAASSKYILEATIARKAASL
jgi:hypothetical protein